MKNNKFSVYIPILLALAVVTGIILGNRLNRNDGMNLPKFMTQRSNKITAIIDLISSSYVDSVSANNLVEEAIPEILKNLDPHTSYIAAKDMQGVEEEMRGNFGGIGIQFSVQSDTVLVIDVISGGPSSKLGVLPGDRIVTVNDTIIAGIGIKNETVLTKLRGEKGTRVDVGIKRKGFDELIDFEIIRGEIPIYSVDVSYMIDSETGYIKVSRFAEQTYNEFMDGMKKLDNLGAKNVIIDLRGNPGGYLMAVIQMVNEFLEEGQLIVYTEGRSQPRKVYDADSRGRYRDKGVVVLIDDFSASASEIFAGAIQDNDRGWIIGRRSFGKGLVQEQIPFTDGSAIRLTVARYYTPSGRCIQKSYENGNEKYYHDIMDRAEHGEFEVADSIHFEDTLKYQTISGRTVYGGGGIMPDQFVPADTSGYTDYFLKVTQKGLVYQFALDYADKNREILNQLKTASDFESYLSDQNILTKFIKFASEKGIDKNVEDLKKSGDIIDNQLKAYIARNIIGEEGFYPIIMRIDNVMQIAIQKAGIPVSEK